MKPLKKIKEKGQKSIAKWRKTMNKWKKLMNTWKIRDGLKTRLPDATEIMKRVQNMTHLECPIYARKKFRMIFFSFLFFDDGGILSATGDRDRLEAF